MPTTNPKYIHTNLRHVEEGDDISIATETAHIRGDVTDVETTADEKVVWVTVDGKTVRSEYVGDEDAGHYDASSDDFAITVGDEPVEALARWDEIDFMPDKTASEIDGFDEAELDEALQTMELVQREVNLLQNCYRMIDAERMTLKEFEEEMYVLAMQHGGELRIDAAF